MNGDEPHGIDEWMAVLRLIAVLAPLTPEERCEAIAQALHRLAEGRPVASGAGSLPGYWMHETSGVLRPVVERYLARDPLTTSEIATMRAYLRQWITNGAWQGNAIRRLRESVDAIATQRDIDRWLAMARRGGIDPL